ncbi:MAG: response regulator [Lachnospiraceae bacterium]|nr:response regulator [Lachnospiraceae bacterium]
MWKVMAADDEAYMRDALEKLIHWKGMGCELRFVGSNGKELVEQMETEHPDIVITDVKMPLMDGLEICKYVYETCPEAQVIILSAYSDFGYARTAIHYSVCEYVLKISVLEELPRAVEKAIRNLEKNRREFLPPEKDAVAKDSVEKDTDSLYNQIVRFIEENYQSRITLDDMAEKLHANRSYLSRLYKSRRGVNLFDDILRMRIEKAKEYIESTDWKIYEVSEAVGFDDTGYFSRVFKKYTRMSTKEYKNARKDSYGQD